MELAFWLGLMVVLIVVESLTTQLICVWFAVGSLAAFIAALFSAPLWGQAAIGVAVSIALLALTRPLVKKFVHAKSVPTNADRVLGQTGKVTEAVDNLEQTGAVYALGKEWTARSASGERIEMGTVVSVERLEGVKLWVSAAQEAAPQEAETVTASKP